MASSQNAELISSCRIKIISLESYLPDYELSPLFRLTASYSPQCVGHSSVVNGNIQRLQDFDIDLVSVSVDKLSMPWRFIGWGTPCAIWIAKASTCSRTALHSTQTFSLYTLAITYGSFRSASNSSNSS
jgi:hypothetical protein